MGPDIATIAALIGDPARAQMLCALMGGRALTATELAREAGVTPQTASGHLAKLEAGGLTVVRRQGRHRYVALAGEDVAAAVEALSGLSAERTARVRPGPRDAALRRARVCYNHLAGEIAVGLLDSLVARGALDASAGLALTPAGFAAMAALGIDAAALGKGRSRAPLVRECLDWSERRPHLGGSLGRALLGRILELGWARRVEGSRAVVFTPEGERRVRLAFPADARAA